MPIRALSLYLKDWTIKARLTKKAPKIECKNKRGFVMPLEFMDEEGTQITALACGEIVEPLSKTLRENKVYLVSNGTVKIAAKKFTSVKNDFSLFLDGKSIVEEVDDDIKIGNKGFNFTMIKAIGDLNEGAVIDVLGEIQSVGPRQAHAPKKSGLDKLPQTEKMYKRILSIIDESKCLIDVTLWRELAEKELSTGLIVALKRVKVTAFNGKQLTSMRDTEIIIDPPEFRVKEIKKM